MTKSGLTAIVIIAILCLTIGLATAEPGHPGITGLLTVVWGDSPPGSDVPSLTTYYLTDDAGQTTQLFFSEDILRTLGGVVALNGQRVVVEGEMLPLSQTESARQGMQVTHLQPATGQSSSSSGTAAISGSRPWVTILCKFADFADEPESPSFFEGLHGSTEPGLDHYWRELSYGTINIEGSAVVDHWYTLPHPRSHYSGTMGYIDLNGMFDDCTAAADSDIYFPYYDGVNIALNTTFGDYAWGGSRYAYLDGQFKLYSTTWLPPWGYRNQGVLAHEMGHGFGLPHSSGNYGNTYDNCWDVMSDHWSTEQDDPVYGNVGQHTIAYHKNMLGWIPPGQRYQAAWGTQTRIHLDRLALPQGGNYLMALIPIGGSGTNYYTVEARQLMGYDVGLLGPAVVIHEVDIYRTRPAYVIDIDNNGEVEDGGSMWEVGEAFVDAPNEIAVCVEGETPDGFIVTVKLGAGTDCTFQPDLSGSTTQVWPLQPSNGDLITLTTRLINWGIVAQNVVVTETVPSFTTYISGSVATSRGTVAGSGPFVFSVGTLTGSLPVTLTYSAQVSPGLILPTSLIGPVDISWDGGMLQLSHAAIANGHMIYLPVAFRNR